MTDGNTDAKVAYDGGKEEAHYRYGNAPVMPAIPATASRVGSQGPAVPAQLPAWASTTHQWEMYTSAKRGVIWGARGT